MFLFLVSKDLVEYSQWQIVSLYGCIRKKEVVNVLACSFVCHTIQNTFEKESELFDYLGMVCFCLYWMHLSNPDWINWR